MRFRSWVIVVFVVFAWFSSQAPAGEGCLEVVGGFDGANPQSDDAIVRETADRFRVRPSNEEGSNDSYFFRFNTKVLNHCAAEKGIELLVEWPALEQHPDYNYDTYYYGDKGQWSWTYADVDANSARLRLQAGPGITYVGSYPRYSYGHYEEFVHGLVSSDILQKWEEGRSYEGRRIYAVRISRPGLGEGRLPILITARNHPYETSGSYIVEEMIHFLQSESEGARRLRDEHIFYFLPMMNPDGVAHGMNQRTRPNGTNLSYGVDSDDPASKTLLGFVRRIHPGLWADIHSWPHQGDDGMWCTHEWVAEGLLSQLPDRTFQDYVWNVSFVRDRGTAENHLWQWLIRTFDSGGVSLSISWYRRNEAEMDEIAVGILKALSHTLKSAH